MHGHELLTPEEMGRADRLAIAAGVPGLELMEAAGRAVADAAIALVARKGAAIAVLCGPGNNGGDGFVAARLLREQGYRVRVGLLGARERLTGDAAAMADRWGADIEALTPATLRGADLVIDAMFGAGLSRPLDGAAAEVADAINASGKPVLAVDVPSGLDGTTGCADGAGGAGDAHRHVLPHEARASAAAGAAAVRRGAARRHRHPRARAARRCRRGPSLTAPRCGVQPMRFRASMRTNTRAGTRSWCRARPRAPALPGSARAARCASAPVS